MGSPPRRAATPTGSRTTRRRSAEVGRPKYPPVRANGFSEVLLVEDNAYASERHVDVGVAVEGDGSVITVRVHRFNGGTPELAASRSYRAGAQRGPLLSRQAARCSGTADGAKEDLDGPEEALVALLPPDAEPMAALYLLPSFVLRMAARTGLDVPAALQAPPVAELLDELHWRGDGGRAPAAREDLPTLAALAADNFVALTDSGARVSDGALKVLDRLTRALCDAPFAAAIDPKEAA